jgi:hypothetical protein
MPKVRLLIALVLSLSLLPLTPVSLVQAQESSSSFYQDEGSSINWVIVEPKNQTYNTSTLNLNVTVETFMATLTNVTYRIDNQAKVTLPMRGQKTADDPITQRRTGMTLLPTLTNGVHKLTVYIDGLAGFPSETIRTQKTVLYFEIKTNSPIQDTSTYGHGATIYSPCNRTYDRNEVIIIKASSATLGGANIIYKGTYSIDDGAPRNLRTESVQTHSWDPFFGALIGTATLPQLPEGKHKLTIYLKTYIESTTKPPTMAGEATVYFAIGDVNPPNITFNELDGAIFNQSHVPLSFMLNEPVTWRAYSLDNATLMDIMGNTTLTIAAGNHTIILYANDTAGNTGQSEMVHFTVQIENIELRANDIAVLGSIVLVIIVTIAAFLFAKRKRKLFTRSV